MATDIFPSEFCQDGLQNLRIQNPYPIFEGSQPFAKDTTKYVESLSGSATSTFVSNQASVQLLCTTTNGDSAIRQTKYYFPYQSHSLTILMSALMGAIKANVRQRIGYFDANNGYFWEQDGTNLKVVRRTGVTGSPVDNAVNQSSWNIDKLDGTGPSGVTIDMTKVQKFYIDFGWINRVKMGFIINGLKVFCHEFDNSNSLATVPIGAANLPCRFEISNTATTASQTTMLQISVSVFCNASIDALGLVTTQNTGLTTRNAPNGTVTLPTISVRLTSAHIRGLIIPKYYCISLTQGRATMIQIFVGGTITGGAWNTAGPATEFNITGTALTGGTMIWSSVASNATEDLRETLPPLGLLWAAADFAGANAEPLTIMTGGLGGTTTHLATLVWQEIG